MNPGVSVLLPVRDAAPTLGAALRSLERQTLHEHEVVAVDDGSRDATADMLEAAAARDRRIRVIHTPPRGIALALNEALSFARAPLVARMDADDIAHSDRLRQQQAFLRAHEEVSILGTRVRVFGGTLNEGMRRYVAWSNQLTDDGSIRRDLLVESPLVHPSVMMRAAALRDLGGYRDFDGPEDYDLWLRASGRGLRFAKLDETLLLWRDGTGRLTRRGTRYAADRFLALKVAHLRQGPLRGRLAVVWGAGPVGKALAAALVASGGRLAAWAEVSPRRLGCEILGARVLSAEAAVCIDDAVHLGAVGQPGARERLRALARKLGLVEGETYFALA